MISNAMTDQALSDAKAFESLFQPENAANKARYVLALSLLVYSLESELKDQTGYPISIHKLAGIIGRMHANEVIQ